MMQYLETFLLPFKLLSDISQTGDACKLHEHHRCELLPSIEALILTAALEFPAFDAIKNVSNNKLGQLTEDCATICHGLILLLY
jgi:hypothetical protein